MAEYTKIASSTVYSDVTGLGIGMGTTTVANEKTGKDALTDGFLTSAQPYYFSIKLRQGNYQVKLNVGDGFGTADIAVRSECRRMMVNRLQTQIILSQKFLP